MIISPLLLFTFCILLSAAAIYMAIQWANIYRIADNPGEHKQHSKSTPFVGGVGVFVSLCAALVVLIIFYPEQMQKWLVLGSCSVILFSVGFVDDIVRLSYKPRLIIQLIVALMMVLAGGVVLHDLGELLPVQLGPLEVIFTVFATIGVFNAINMIDGIDGLSGSLSLVSMLLLGIVTYAPGSMPYFILIVAITGGLIGFLYFNLRHLAQSHARVFLGNNGSMLIGLLFAWLLVDISQGGSPAIRPVTAIWLLSIPLIDAVGIIHRRIYMGVSPFKPDRNHLHHILLRAGYRTEEVVFSLVFVHLLLGTIGLIGLHLAIPDFILLIGFFLVYAWLFYLMLHPWHFIPALCLMHTLLGLTPIASRNTFFGRYIMKDSHRMAMVISKELRGKVDYWVRIFKQPSEDSCPGQHYAIALKIRLTDNSDNENSRIRKYIKLLENRLEIKHGIKLRQLAERKEDNDWSLFSRDAGFGELELKDQRKTKHRSLNAPVLAFEVTWAKGATCGKK